jgi:DNA-binding NtrC family response regulator
MARGVVLFSREGAPSAPGLREALKICAITPIPAASSEHLVQVVDEFSPDGTILLCTDAVDGKTLEMVEQARQIDCRCPVLILASSVTTEAAIRAMRAGVSDLLETSASTETLVTALRRHFVRLPTGPNRDSNGSPLIGGSKMVGHSTAIARVRSQIAQIAASDANVLITGESGTGKELAAELIHRNSRVSTRPFVAINCAAVPEALLESELFGFERGAFTGASMARKGKLQQASGGTLFLDEVGDMSLAAQAKILRAVENRVVQRLGSNVDIPVQIRLLAATNQNLEVLTREKKFRLDLYFRLNVVRLNMPPLRERIEDIVPLTEHILVELSQKQNKSVRRIEGDLLRRLRMYDWPGNIRELGNVLESILVFASSRSIGLSDVPAHIRHTLSSSSRCYGADRSKILAALNSADWNRGKAARILQCSRMTLYRKMVKLSLQPGKD